MKTAEIEFQKIQQGDPDLLLNWELYSGKGRMPMTVSRDLWNYYVRNQNKCDNRSNRVAQDTDTLLYMHLNVI